MKLRPTRINELDFVYSLEHDKANERFITPWEKEQHRRLLGSNDTFHAVILDNGDKPVGYLFVNGLQRDDHVLELKRLVVAEKGSGFGRFAVQQVKKLAFEEWNARRLWLDVRDFNDSARRLYESEGFQLDGPGDGNLLVYSISTPLQQNHTGTMAQNYDSFFGKTDEDIEFILSYSTKAPVIVEFGIGAGRLAIPMAGAGSRVIGVDLSEEMLIQCLAKAKAAGLQIALHQGRMDSFDGKVRADLVVCGCRSFLHNLTRDSQISTLKNFKRHLADDGRAIISAWYFDSAKVQKLKDGAIKRYQYMDAQGREWETTIEHRRVDEIHQTVDAVFGHYFDGRLVDENEVSFRWINPSEFELLADLAGLKVEARFGDFQGSVFSGQEDIIWVMGHA